jgi:phospholipase C
MTHDFTRAVKAGNFPAVSYLKALAYQDGHAGYSDPLDEQAGIVTLINFIQQLPDWKNTAVIVTWDDSDGWYDHAFTKPTNPSADAQADRLDGPGKCGTGTPMAGRRRQAGEWSLRSGNAHSVPGDLAVGEAEHCQPLADSQASVTRFIEDNWLQGKRLGGGSFDATSRIDHGHVRLCRQRQRCAALSGSGDRQPGGEPPTP